MVWPVKRSAGAVFAAVIAGVALPVATPGVAAARQPDPLGYKPVRATFAGTYSMVEDTTSDDGLTTSHTEVTVTFEIHGSQLRLGLRGPRTWRPLGEGSATMDYRESTETRPRPGEPCSASGYEVVGSGEAELEFVLGIPGRDLRPRESRRIRLTNRWTGVELEAAVPAVESSWREQQAVDGSCVVVRETVPVQASPLGRWLEGKVPKRGRVVRLHPQRVAEGPTYRITDSTDATIRLSRNPALRW
jgi:hypothetical protein